MGINSEDMEALFANEDDIQLASRSLKSMAHPLRLKIVCIIAGKTEACVQDIVDQVGTSQSNVSQHLAKLRDEGIITSRKEFNKVYYRISALKVLKLISSLRDAFCRPLA